MLGYCWICHIQFHCNTSVCHTYMLSIFGFIFDWYYKGYNHFVPFMHLCVILKKGVSNIIFWIWILKEVMWSVMDLHSLWGHISSPKFGFHPFFPFIHCLIVDKETSVIENSSLCQRKYEWEMKEAKDNCL